jgi:DNA gyrase/topoisomerase IV subunit A
MALRVQRTTADEILSLRLYQLTGLEREKIDREYKALIDINDLRDILAKGSAFHHHQRYAKPATHGSPRLTQSFPTRPRSMEDLIAMRGASSASRMAASRTAVSVSCTTPWRKGNDRHGDARAQPRKRGDRHLFLRPRDYLMFFTATDVL